MKTHKHTSRIFYKDKDHKDVFYGGSFHMVMNAITDEQTMSEKYAPIYGCDGVVWRKLNEEDCMIIPSNGVRNEVAYIYYPNERIICAYNFYKASSCKQGSMFYLYGNNNLYLTEDGKAYEKVSGVNGAVCCFDNNNFVSFANGKMNWYKRQDKKSEWVINYSFDSPSMGGVFVNHGTKFFFNGVGTMSGFYDETGKISDVTTCLYRRVLNGEQREFTINMQTWGMTNDCDYCACYWTNTRTLGDLVLATGGMNEPWHKVDSIEYVNNYYNISAQPRVIDNHLFIHRVENETGITTLKHYYIGNGRLQPQSLPNSVSYGVLENDYGISSVKLSFVSSDNATDNATQATIPSSNQGYASFIVGLYPVGASKNFETYASSCYARTVADTEGRIMIIVVDSLTLESGFAFYIDSIPAKTCRASESQKWRVDEYLGKNYYATKSDFVNADAFAIYINSALNEFVSQNNAMLGSSASDSAFNRLRSHLAEIKQWFCNHAVLDKSVCIKIEETTGSPNYDRINIKLSISDTDKILVVGDDKQTTNMGSEYWQTNFIISQSMVEVDVFGATYSQATTDIAYLYRANDKSGIIRDVGMKVRKEYDEVCSVEYSNLIYNPTVMNICPMCMRNGVNYVESF